MRSRNIKPAFFQNEVLTEVDPFGRLLFIGLWCLADREGRLEDRPKRIKMQLFAMDDVDVPALLDDLARLGFIVRYEVDGVAYIQVVNFSKHQRPHSNESASVIPAPMDDSTSHHGEQDVQPREASLRPDTGYLIPDSLTVDTGLPEAREAPTPDIQATAETLADAPWIQDDIDAVVVAVARAFGLVPAFDARDGPVEAEKFALYHAEKPPANWYRAYLNWLKKAAKFDAQNAQKNGHRNGYRPRQRTPNYDGINAVADQMTQREAMHR